VVECERYGEIFNLRAQNFRLQKKRPALILAEKSGSKVLPTPPGYSIGRDENHYFSHMLNCLYDCRYCFLQGMYQSAHYVLFVNWEDFEEEIDESRRVASEASCYFSGYDCDSLAMDSITGFAGHFIPFFTDRQESWLELRTKSLNTKILEQHDPVPNIITAYTLTPEPIAKEVGHGAPQYRKRLDRVKSLTRQGWLVGLRLDPLVPWPGFADLYQEMIREVFSAVEADRIHSVTLGAMRFPKAMHERIVKLYPEDPLFALQEMSVREGQMSYRPEIETELVETIHRELSQYLPESRIFRQSS